jgi:carboxymethylenebutenolidase
MAMSPSDPAAVPLIATDVEIQTPDGSADAFFARPAKNSAPGVLMWPDIFGLRPTFREMAKRLAQAGYAVLVVNPFYRMKKAPTAAQGSATPTEELRPLVRALNASTQGTDAKAFLAWLDRQEAVAKDRRMGTLGYCMGGAIALRTAAAVPDRVGAVASFHGAGLVTDQPDSPHLEAAKTRAEFLIAIAQNDDERAPKDKYVLRETFAKAELSAEIDVYPAAHGWCPPDSRVYDKAQAEKAWSRLLALFGRALA